MPENAEEELKNANLAPVDDKPEKYRMICPHTKVRPGEEATNLDIHRLKFKDLITLKLAEDPSTKEFGCEVCKKKLGH